MRKTAFSASAATLLLAAGLAAPAMAQSTQPEGAVTVGDVVVTAQRREQSLQDVPIVVTSLSQEVLQDAGVKDIKDLTILTPGMTVTSTTTEASTTARIRGVGTVGDNPGLESSVGVVIDGVYRSRNGVGFGDLGEMARIWRTNSAAEMSNAGRAFLRSTNASYQACRSSGVSFGVTGFAGALSSATGLPCRVMVMFSPFSTRSSRWVKLFLASATP